MIINSEGLCIIISLLQNLCPNKLSGASREPRGQPLYMRGCSDRAKALFSTRVNAACLPKFIFIYIREQFRDNRSQNKDNLPESIN